MKRRLILLFFVALFAVLSCTYGLTIFEDYRDRKLLERKTQDFSPEKTLVAGQYGMSSNNLLEMAAELMDLADRMDGDVILRAYKTIDISDNQAEAPPVIDFVYSAKTDLFAGNVFSTNKIDWSRSGAEAFSLKPEPDLGSILTIRDRLEGEDISRVRQQIVAPLALLKEFYPRAGSGTDVDIFFQCEDVKEARAYLKNEMETVSFESVQLYDDYYQLMYFFEPMMQDQPYLMVIVFMAAILLIILALFSLEIIEATREISVRKILGQGTRHIVSRLLYRLVFFLVIIFILSSVVTLLIIVKNWNRLTLTFVGYLALLLAAFIVMLLFSLFIAYVYVKRINPVVSAKRQTSLGFFLNFGLLMKMILVLLLGTQLLALFPELVTVWGEWRAEQVYGENYLGLEVAENCPKEKQANTENMLKLALQEGAKSLEFLYTDTALEGSHTGSFNKKGEMVLIPLTQSLGMSTYQVTLENKILDLDGEEIRFTEPPEQSVVLVSENADLKSMKEDPFYRGFSAGTPQIKIRSDQTILMPDGNYLENAILIILSNEDFGSDFDYLLDTNENRAILTSKLEDLGADSDCWQFTTRPLIQLGEENKYTLGRYLWMALFLVVAFIVQSAHNAEVYATDRAKLLHLRYLHGVPFLRRYGELWLRALVPYLLVLAVYLLFPSLIQSLLMVGYEGVFLDSYKTELSLKLFVQLFGTLLLFDLLLHAGVIRRLQKKSVTRLKGER
ncbi:MAG: ABC transporter permease [Eubacteriales bacterium]|nr:ABC transporter permease [Eubacteriales bacterium]MDD3610777.1 ABC transporter permease [Eubacteriales bacterium]